MTFSVLKSPQHHKQPSASDLGAKLIEAEAGSGAVLRVVWKRSTTQRRYQMENLHPVMRSALAPFAPPHRALRQPEGYDDEMEQGCCAVCNGSGEGQYEGTRCYSCKGSGTDWYPVKKSPTPDEDDEEDFEGAPV